jgi:O-acetyl-ADP-ribose deacetylase (regulator of RNase III)/transcriptional regulator with XRE-family HTH domain
MPFTIIRQDITKMQVDAIVNAANTSLAMGGGVCGAIFKAAGPAKLQTACDKLAPIKTGGAAITPGFGLPAKFIIHAAGPVYQQWNAKDCARLLRSAYTESLQLAWKNGCESIAFPLISSGIYGYPKEEAFQVAVCTIQNFLADHDMHIYLVIFDRVSFLIDKELMGAVESYIDENYVDAFCAPRRNLLNVEQQALEKAVPVTISKGLRNLMEELDEPFNCALLRLIDAKGMTDAQVYKRANIDRKLFSKIRTGKGYTPSKRTILALSIALELTLDETADLLEKAGYALSHSQKMDVIVEFFIVNGKYDIYRINEVLFQYDQPLLGSV